MNSSMVAALIGLALIALSIWGIRRGLRFWGLIGIVLAIMIVLFGSWSDTLETGEDSGDEPIPFEVTLPSGEITPAT